MITEEQILIYIHYEGNDDYFGWCASQEHKDIISDDDWVAIRNLVQDIILVRRNFTTKNMQKKLIEKYKKTN